MYLRKSLILCFRSHIQNPESDTPPHAYGFLSPTQTEDRETRMMRYVSNTPPPAVGGGRGRGKQHLEQAPLYPKEKLKKEVLCFSQILYRVFHSIVLQIRCFSIVSAREGRYDLFNHLKSDLK